MNKRDVNRIEKADGFKRLAVEEILLDAIEASVGERPVTFPSLAPGVVAIERIYPRGNQVLDWQRIASEVAIKTNIGLLCIANCDWQMPKGADEDATYIAFDIPSLPQDYATSHRNSIFPVDPADAPSSEDFDRRSKAAEILQAKRQELHARGELLKLTGKPHSHLVDEANRLMEIQTGMQPSDREMAAAILALDFDKALELAASEPEQAAAPGL